MHTLKITFILMLAVTAYAQGWTDPAFVNAASLQAPVGGGEPPSWVPTDASGLVMWLKSDSLATNIDNVYPPETNASPIIAWGDQLGSNTVYFDSSKFTWYTNFQNSLPALRSAQGCGMSNSTLAGLFSGADMSMTLAMAFSIFSWTNNYLMSLGNTADGDSQWLFYRSYTTNMVFRRKDNGATGVSSVFGLLSDTNFHTIIYVINITNVSCYVDGAVSGSWETQTNNVATVTTDYLRLGKYTGSTSIGLDGFIGECCVYSGPISSSDRTNLQTYLKNRWNTP